MMSRVCVLMMSVLPGLSACTADRGTKEAWVDIPGASGVPAPVVGASGGRVIDPSLDGAPALALEVTLSVRAEGASCEVELELVSEHGAVWSDLAALPWGTDAAVLRWSGVDGEGVPFPAGVVEAYAWSACADGSQGSGHTQLAVVRLVPGAVDVGAVRAVDEVPLAFHRQDLVTATPTAIQGPELRLAPEDALAQADTTDGPRPLPEPWTEPDRAPWSVSAGEVAHNVPAALVMGATPTLTATPAASALAGGNAVPTIPPGVLVQLLAPTEATWSPGLPVTAVLPALEMTVGREVLTAEWRWAACFPVGDCELIEVPGSRTSAHEVYRLLGPPMLRDGSTEGYADGTPWIGTLADTVDAVEGAEDAFAVMDALRERLYTDPWLIYDPGVSSYSEYEGAYIYWENITSELSAWLSREQGVRLYCHSMSCLLSTLGQTWGADVEQIVLGVGFGTNLTRAAGTSSWARWSFNSHSVAAMDGGAWVWDASIDLDGDDDPASEPVEAISPSGMPGEEYLWRLTFDDIDIVNQGRCFVR